MLSTLSSRSLVLVGALLLVVHGFAQNFNGFTYQAVVRDIIGDPVPSQPVGVQVTIQVGPSDTYVETHGASTDAYGLIALTIGQGTPVGGSAIPSFADVAWDSGLPITYTVAVDVTGGTTYTFLSGGPFKAVPFAMHALTSDSSSTSTPQTLSLSNDTLYITGGNSVDLSGLANEPGWVVSGDTLHNGGKRVGIGTSTPDTTLHVVGGIKYQDGTQGTGKVLKSDANGLASWGTLSGSDVLSTPLPPATLSCPVVVGTAVAGLSGPSDVAVSGNYAYVLNASSGYLTVINISDPQNPQSMVSVYTTSTSVAISGSYAYVTGTDNWLRVWSISDPWNPYLAGQVNSGLSGPSDVAVSGNYAYVTNAASGYLTVINISDPQNPQSMVSVYTGSNPTSVAVSGSFAYVTSDNTLNVWYIGDPWNPYSTGSVTTGTSPRSVAVSGNYAYVVNNSSNTMQVINITNPAAPQVVGTVNTGNGPRSVTVSGNYAYVANVGSNSLQVFNITNPAAPTVAGSVATGNGPRSVAVTGNYAYVVNQGSNTMQVIDLLCSVDYAVTVNPATGQTTAVPYQWNTSGNTISNANTGNVGIGTATPTAKLDVAGTVKIADGTQGTGKVLKSDANGLASWGTLSGSDVLSTPLPPATLSCPVVVGSLNMGGTPFKSAVSGNFAYVANVISNTLQVLNISNPAAPTLVGTVGTGSFPRSVVVSGNYAYVVNTLSNTMQVINITNPAVPAVVGTVLTGNSPRELAVSGNYVYVVNSTSNTLQVINISNPSSPAVVGTVSTGNLPESIAVSGNYAYVTNTNSSTMQVINISNPAAPTVAGSVATAGAPISVAVAGNYAYLVTITGNTMQVINITNPASPTIATAVATGTQPTSLTVSGNYAYVLRLNYNDLQVFNISNPAAPTVDGTVATASGPQSVTVSGNYAYVVHQGSNTMQVIDLLCSVDYAVTVNPATGQTTAVPYQWNTSGNTISNANTGNVGIATSSPTSKLHINHSSSVGSNEYQQHGLMIGGLATGNMQLLAGVDNTAQVAYIQSIKRGILGYPLVLNTGAGNVGIGTTAPATKLEVAGTTRSTGYTCRAGTGGAYSGNVYNFNWTGSAMQGWVDGTYVGLVGGLSDRRLKEGLAPLGDDAISRVMQLKPTSYRFKKIEGTIFTGSDELIEGFIADELQRVIPSAVSGTKDGLTSDGQIQPQTVTLAPVVSVLTKAIQEQQAQLEAQQKRIDELTERLRALEKK